MTSPLLTRNPELKKNNAGVWKKPQAVPFDYSDGTASEHFLKCVLKTARDVGSFSRELETSHAVWDWSSEYHFSPRRANIVRGFDFQNCRTALELGSGCGAITRYLGEAGVAVDAVEGSGVRAEICRMRCRELKNMTVVKADFNNIQLPENAYDLVFFIGVLEYAARFLPGSLSAEAAVLNILSAARKSTKPDGVIVIAIENRYGLKYWLGATEDHFGEPYVGLAGYPRSRGTRTFDRDEWKRLLAQTGMEYRFLYPFPDYKLADTVLSDDFVRTDPFAYSLLYQVRSRDYLADWRPSGSEFLIWKSLHRKNAIHRFVNSFVIVLSAQKERLDAVFPNDFVCFPGFSRKPAYRSITMKPKDRAVIIKKSLMDTTPSSALSTIRHRNAEASYHRGELLSTLWLETLSTPEDWKAFQGLVGDYYVFVTDHETKGTLHDFDMLPSNLIVTEDQHYRRIDTEWSADFDLSVDFVFFRALFWFSCDNHQSLRSVFKKKQVRCPMDFIRFGFEMLGMRLTSLQISEWIKTEEAIQECVGIRQQSGMVRKIIHEPFPSFLEGVGPDHHTVRVYWADSAAGFIEDRSCYTTVPAAGDRACLPFRFRASDPVARLRVKPTQSGGLFQFRRIALERVGEGSGTDTALWEISDPERIAAAADLSDIAILENSFEKLFFAASGESHLTFTIPEHGEPESSGGLYLIWVEMIFPRNPSYHSAENAFRFSLAQQNTTVMENRSESETILPNRSERDERKDSARLSTRLQEKETEVQVVRQHLREKENRMKQQIVELYRSKAKLQHMEVEFRSMGRWLSRFRRLATGRLPGQSLLSRLLGRPTGLKTARAFGLEKAYERITASGLFDIPYYKSQGPDLDAYGEDPVLHYLLEGVIMGIDPNPLFSSFYYIENTPKLVETGRNPLDHYIESGGWEGRDPSPYFITLFYLEQYPDVADSGIHPMVHFMTVGYREDRWPHPLFDTEFYKQKYPDVAASDINPLVDFRFSMEAGKKRDPNPFFSTTYYLERYPDVAAADINPLVHYFVSGAEENRNPCSLFQTAYYKEQNLEVVESGMNPLAHYLHVGAAKDLNPHPLFDALYYKWTYPDVSESGVAPLLHYITIGLSEERNPHPLFDVPYLLDQAEDRASAAENAIEYYLETADGRTCNPHPLFDVDYYLSLYPDVAEAGVPPLLHYLSWGSKEGRRPHPLFDPEYYLSKNPDVIASGMNPLAHYVWKGSLQRKNPHPAFDVDFYLKRYPDVAGSGLPPPIHFLSIGAPEGRYVSKQIEALSYRPKISIVLLPNLNPGRQHTGALSALRCQLYPCIEILSFFNPNERHSSLHKITKISQNDSRIQLFFPDAVQAVGILMNQGLQAATGEFVLFVSPSVFLHCDGIFRFVQFINRNADVDVISTDGRNLDLSQRRVEGPYDHKRTAVSSYYISPMTMYRKTLLENIGGFQSWHTGVSDPDFLNRVVAAATFRRIVHLPKRIYDLPL